jgi:hypothetical protein
MPHAVAYRAPGRARLAATPAEPGHARPLVRVGTAVAILMILVLAAVSLFVFRN